MACAEKLFRASRPLIALAATICLGWAVRCSADESPAADADATEFFESRIRPLLVKKCYACHSAAADPVEGNLRLDTRDGWMRGGDRGPAIVPGKPDKSLLMKVVLYQNPDLSMPPDNRLSRGEQEQLRRWIRMGAPDPRTGRPNDGPMQAIDWDQAQTFWSFRKIVRPEPPAVMKSSWVRSPIDRFVLARLEQRGLQPVAAATRATLIRRLTLDLTGLPATADEVAAFQADGAADAYARLVDRLLANPRYGETWTRHWLDVVRYADDQLRTEYYYRDLPHAWQYRDWVIRALNADLPYDQFVMEQIAGDLLRGANRPQRFQTVLSGPAAGQDGVVAVGLLALGMMYQSDGNTPDGIAVARAETIDDRVDTVSRGLLGLTVSCARCHDHKFDPIPTEDYYALAGIFNNTKYVETAPIADPLTVARFQKRQSQIKSLQQQLAEARKANDSQQLQTLNDQLQALEQPGIASFSHAHSIVDSGNQDMRLALRGNLRNRGPVVPRRFLRVLSAANRPHFTRGSGRMELAAAIGSPDNPLTARVICNRLWQHHFGRGIVATASNFGNRGAAPTHPQLLDWLASRLVSGRWSLKQVHREILLSATYRLSTDFDADNHRIDGQNLLLWRMERRRLTIEAWRDSLLAVSGNLREQFGGPAAADLLNSDRRTVYGTVRRDRKQASDDLLKIFDFPNPRMTSSGRTLTTVPQQQLFALNNVFVIRQARGLAAQLGSLEANRDNRIQRAFRRVYSREPSPAELQLAQRFLSAASNAANDGSLSLWEQYCQVLLSSNEFLFRP